MSLKEMMVEMLERMRSLEEAVGKLANKDLTKKEINAMRRKMYREKKEAETRDRLVLPEWSIFNRKDRRVSRFYKTWAEKGLELGRKNQPAAFLTWMMWQWNNRVYTKKPVTYSGSCYHVWNGHARYGIGPGDLMHLYRKRTKMVPFLRNKAEWQDFCDRPMWNWGSYVLFPVVMEMKQDPSWLKLSEHFRHTLYILCGGFAELTVGETNWDFNESMDRINKMMKTIGPRFKMALEALASGLRSSAEP